jgi:hypothetical protein
MDAVDSLSEDVVSDAVFKGENPGPAHPSKVAKPTKPSNRNRHLQAAFMVAFSPWFNQVKISRFVIGRLKDADADTDTSAAAEAGR